MQKILNKIIIMIFFLNTSCVETLDDVKKGLGGGKRTTTDEFLVKKKDPLTMPPRWEELPVPGKSSNIEMKIEEVTDIEQLIQVNKNEADIIESDKNTNLEESFLKKIKQK